MRSEGERKHWGLSVCPLQTILQKIVPTSKTVGVSRGCILDSPGGFYKTVTWVSGVKSLIVA
jgi:hypothetical protein